MMMMSIDTSTVPIKGFSSKLKIIADSGGGAVVLGFEMYSGGCCEDCSM